MSVSTITAAKTADSLGQCPPWCEPGLSEHEEGLHLSRPASVPAAGDHVCSYTRSPNPRSCPEVTSAQLVLMPGARRPHVEIYHGDDTMPPISLDAARFLAGHIQALAREGAAAEGEPDPVTGCPWSWCTKDSQCTDREPGTGLHMSAGRGVPVAGRQHACGYLTGSPARRSQSCDRDVSAWLVRGDEDSEARVVLHHGDDCIPEMPLAAAADLAAALLRLADEASTGRPYWLTGPCPAWCDQAHSDADPAGDRWHFGKEHTVVTLTTEDAEVEAIGGGKPEASAADLAAYLRQDYRESEPRILLLHNDRDSAYLTLGEAETLARGVLDLARLARSSLETGS